MEPLAIATNATQGDHARLDVVLITLGNLYHTYCDTATYGADTQAVMHKSLEAHWKKTAKERELYILAIVLNPMLRTTPFRENNPLLTPQNLWAMFKRNYTRMERHNTDQELKTAFTEYLTGVGEWSDEGMGLTEALEFAKHTVRALGFNFSDAMPLITNDQQQGIYRLVFFARNPLPNRIWDDIAQGPNRELF